MTKRNWIDDARARARAEGIAEAHDRIAPEIYARTREFREEMALRERMDRIAAKIQEQSEEIAADQARRAR